MCPLLRDITWSKDVAVVKTVERKSAEDREVVRYRQKADGGSIAIVRATDEELLLQQSAFCQRTTNSL